MPIQAGLSRTESMTGKCKNERGEQTGYTRKRDFEFRGYCTLMIQQRCSISALAHFRGVNRMCLNDCATTSARVAGHRSPSIPFSNFRIEKRIPRHISTTHSFISVQIPQLRSVRKSRCVNRISLQHLGGCVFTAYARSRTAIYLSHDMLAPPCG